MIMLNMNVLGLIFNNTTLKVNKIPENWNTKRMISFSCITHLSHSIIIIMWKNQNSYSEKLLDYISEEWKWYLNDLSCAIKFAWTSGNGESKVKNFCLKFMGLCYKVLGFGLRKLIAQVST